MTLAEELKAQLDDKTFRALAAAMDLNKVRAESAGYARAIDESALAKAQAEQAGYERAMAENAKAINVIDTLRGFAKSWTALIGGLLIALPEILPAVQGDLPSLLGQHAADKVMQISGILMILLRMKTNASLAAKGRA